MTPALVFLPGLFLRTPLLSYAHYAAGLPEEIPAEDPLRAAIYLASRDFYRVLEAKKFKVSELNERELLTLTKYYNRMCYRPTPFGLFSCFTSTAWGDQGTVILPEAADAQLYLLADQSFSQAAAAHAEISRPESVYMPNPTLYRAGKEFRFIRSVPEDSGTKYRFLLESFDANPLNRKLCQWLARRPQAGPAIQQFLEVTTLCSAAEAHAYLQFLKQAQIIRPAQGINIVGTDYFRREGQNYFPAAAHLMKEVPERLNAGDTAYWMPKLEQATAELKGAAPKAGKSSPLYANTEKKALAGALPCHYQGDLARAIEALSRLSLPGQPELMEIFKKEFNVRFEGRKIPLMEALDPETGVGYGDFASQDQTPVLLKDLPFPVSRRQDAPAAWSAAHRLLFAKWNSLKEQDPVIRLNSDDLKGIGLPAYPLPPGMAVMFRITSQGLIVENAGGVTATSLIGRFTPFSEEVHQRAKAAASAEAAANPGVIFAEIGQLSDLHTDNINRRLAVFSHEIPINCSSLLPAENQILPGELLVSVGPAGVILESKRHKQRIIPRLSSAYNFRHNNLALFRFLCDLQYQGLHADLNFDLETYFPQMPHYPRVQFEDVIISPAKWQLRDNDEHQTPEQLRQKLRLPRNVSLSRFDQQLTFDLDIPAERSFFQSCCHGMNNFTLLEAFLPQLKSPTVQTPVGSPLIDQWIALLANPERVYEPMPFTRPLPLKARRTFILGSQWLYLKIYCNGLSANAVLVRRILPVLNAIKADTKLSWFFIRYADPGHHLRLRIKTQEHVTGKVLSLLKQQFSNLTSDRLVREYQADTYRRELERYGGDIIEAVEDLFHASSELVVQFLKQTEQRRTDINRFAISGFVMLLEQLVPDGEEQLHFLQGVTDSFYAEFGKDKKLRVSLDSLFREKNRELFGTPPGPFGNQEPRITPAHESFIAAIERIEKRTEGFTPARKHSLTADLIHMHINRVYPEQQRQQEFVLYYCFYKHRLSNKGRLLKQAGTENVF